MRRPSWLSPRVASTIVVSPLADVGARPASSGGGAAGAGGVPSASRRAMSAPTGSVSPTAATTSSTPSRSIAYVSVALSVSISTSSSPARNASPSERSQRRIVPSSMEAERQGMTTSLIAGGTLRASEQQQHESDRVAHVHYEHAEAHGTDPGGQNLRGRGV